MSRQTEVNPCCGNPEGPSISGEMICVVSTSMLRFTIVRERHSLTFIPAEADPRTINRNLEFTRCIAVDGETGCGAQVDDALVKDK